MDGFGVMHAQPGQLSLTVAKLKDNHDLARELQAGLAAIRGIQRVEADPGQGLVVVVYDKQELTSLTSLLALKAAFATFFPEVNPMQLYFWLSRSM
jgi:hypothetical protein